MTTMKDASRRWWFDSHNGSKRSPWLQSTLSDLDAKTKAMLKLVEDDADSFAERAEMYYKKRPELIGMVEDFYRAHRSLAERFDQARSDHGTTTRFSNRYSLEKSVFLTYQKSDCCSESCESEVEDSEQEKETRDCKDEVLAPVEVKRDGDEMAKLREEIERLREENRVQKEELKQKDEEKREVIRQLSMAMEAIKEENLKIKKSIIFLAKEQSRKNIWNPLAFKTSKNEFLAKLVNGSSRGYQRNLTF